MWDWDCAPATADVAVTSAAVGSVADSGPRSDAWPIDDAGVRVGGCVADPIDPMLLAVVWNRPDDDDDADDVDDECVEGVPFAAIGLFSR